MQPDHPANLDPVDNAASTLSDAADTARAKASATLDSLSDMVVGNPVPAALAAAAVGAGLMALLTMMGRSDPYPRATIPTIPVGSSRGLDYDSLKSQISDIADRLGKALPTDAAKQRVGDATDALSDTWNGVRDQALDVLKQFEPQATAAVKMARENPVWTAVIMGAVGALLGSQLLSKNSGDQNA